MFYSMRIVLLTCLVSFSGMQAIPDTIKKQIFSFVTGVAPVTVGMGVAYLAGRSMKHQYVTTAIGALGGAALDHYYLGGKEDKNQVARKSGNIVPMIFVGGVLYYNNKKIVVGKTVPTINRDGSVSQVPVGDNVYVENDEDVLKTLATPQGSVVN